MSTRLLVFAVILSASGVVAHGQSTFPTAPPPPISPYAATPFAPPPFPASPAPVAPYSPAAVGPPPPIDPYAGASVAPPPPVVPYTYAPPPQPSTFAEPPAPLVPDSAPWQPAPYNVPAPDESYWAKTQRFLQEMSLEYTYLYGKHSDPSDFEINRFELSSTFAVPIFYNTATPLLVTPGFAFNFLEGPLSGAGGPDLPGQLYDAYLDFAWYPRWHEWLGAELGLRPGVWSDFDNVNSDSLRLLGRALASVSVAPNMDILFGAVYLDRIDIKLLPAGGVYYRPTPEWDLYIVFPNPKIRRFLTAVGNSKLYAYGAGEYGGGSWTVERAAPVGDDRIDYNDIRIIGGLEWETQTFLRGHFEIGYVWDREILFVSGMPPNFKPDDTFMIRAGVDF